MSDFVVLGFQNGTQAVLEVQPEPFSQDTYEKMLDTVGDTPYGWSAEEIEEYRTGTDYARALLFIYKNNSDLDTFDVHVDIDVKRFNVCFWNHETRQIETVSVTDAPVIILEDREAVVEDDIVFDRFEVFGDYVLWVEDEDSNRIYDNEKEVMQDIKHSHY